MKFYKLIVLNSMKLHKLYILVLCFLISSCLSDSESKNENDYFNTDSDSEKVEINPINGTELKNDIAAYKTVVNIIRETGLAQNFIIIPGEVKNVVAYIENNERILAFNPEFMNKVKSDTNWHGISILAREIGHHLGNHKLKNGSPSISEELDADRYAGYVLQKMGATLEESINALEISLKEDDNNTNISKNNRISSLIKGYNNAKLLNSDSTMITQIPIPKIDSNESLQQKNNKRKKVNYIYKVFLAVDTSFYFIDDKNNIYSDNNNGQLKVGEKKDSNKPGFDWIFVKGDDTYGVDIRGRLWAFSTDGNFHVIGQALKY